MNTTKSRPILFSAPMVRAILDGSKWKTRRVVKPQPVPDRHWPDDRLEWNPGKLHYTECNTAWNPLDNAFEDYIRNGHCPYGQPGDQLWVKETFTLEPRPHAGEKVLYRADREQKSWAWKPSIFMPRWASRITLEITGIRVERLQEITEEDAKAEGCRLEDWRETSRDPMSEYGQWLANDTPPSKYYSFRNGYRRLWESINSKTHPWASNPWVWVVEFKKI